MERLGKLESYKYGLLVHPDEIRLIELLPGPAQSEIHCVVSHQRLENSPGYEALSYTWGNQSYQKTIFCSDSSATKRKLSITLNCYAALHKLRLLDRSRLLWIDAICINQSDLQERNTQVSSMTRIYQSASQVLIHLGEDADASQLVMEMVKSRDWYGQDGLKSSNFPQPFEPWERAIIRALCHEPGLQEFGYCKKSSWHEKP
jgi:hypothetical protein